MLFSMPTTAGSFCKLSSGAEEPTRVASAYGLPANRPDAPGISGKIGGGGKDGTLRIERLFTRDGTSAAPAGYPNDALETVAARAGFPAATAVVAMFALDGICCGG